MRVIIAIFFILICVAVAHGQQFDVDSVVMSPNLNLTLKNLNVDGTLLDILLSHEIVSSDPDGFYWRLESSTPGLQMQPVYTKTFTYLDEEPVERHQLDIYYTDAPESNKVIMFVPGGAWRQGDKELYDTLGNTLSGFFGFTVVVINYRLSNDEDGGAVHPDHIEDVAAAFAWIKQHISPYGDSQKVYLFGQSAGAHLVSLFATDESWLNDVGYTLSDIRGVVSMSGVYDLPDMVVYPDNPLGLTADEVIMYKKLMFDAFGGWSDADIVEPSPQIHINTEQPPFLIISTYNDLPGFRLEAENFVRAVRSLEPAPEISLRAIEFSDYSDEVWSIASAQAALEPAMAEFVGHWAEVVAINTNEPYAYVPRLVVEFFQSH